MIKVEYPLGLTLGEFRKLTEEHPDNTEIYVTTPDNSFYATNTVLLGPVATPLCQFPAVLLKPKQENQQTKQ